MQSGRITTIEEHLPNVRVAILGLIAGDMADENFEIVRSIIDTAKFEAMIEEPSDGCDLSEYLNSFLESFKNYVARMYVGIEFDTYDSSEFIGMSVREQKVVGVYYDGDLLRLNDNLNALTTEFILQAMYLIANDKLTKTNGVLP